MTTTCDDARALVPSYLDGELSGAQASPLRAHLLDCRVCREVAKDGKTLRRWFAAPPEPVAVPDGFAARVARRAFAGDPGLLVPEPLRDREASEAGSRPLLPFLLLATAVAAAVLFLLALAIQRESLPESNRLEALPSRQAPPWLEPLALEPDEAPTTSIVAPVGR